MKRLKSIFLCLLLFLSFCVYITGCSEKNDDYGSDTNYGEPTIEIDGFPVEEKTIFLLSGKLNATVNAPYVLKLNGIDFDYGTALTAGTYTLTATSAKTEKSLAVKLCVTDELETTLTGIGDSSKLIVGSSNLHFSTESPAAIEKLAAYQTKQRVMMLNPRNGYAMKKQNAHIFHWSSDDVSWWNAMCPQIHLSGAVTKDELQSALDSGYTHFNIDVAIARDSEDDVGEHYYIIDIAKIKMLLDGSESFENARRALSANVKSYMKLVGWMYRNCWKACTVSIEDLIACYGVLDIVPLFYQAYQGNRTAPTFYNAYITDITFKRNYFNQPSYFWGS